MSGSEFVDGKLILRRRAEDRKPLIQRLNRVEGQIRGLKAMIEQDRYCAEELHQIKAAMAALKQVAILIAEQHVAAGGEFFDKRETRAEAYQDMMKVLREALKI